MAMKLSKIFYKILMKLAIQNGNEIAQDFL